MRCVNRWDALSTIGLTGRTMNCLYRVGISTVGDLLDFPESDFIKIRGMGVAGVTELREVLGELRAVSDKSGVVESSESGFKSGILCDEVRALCNPSALVVIVDAAGNVVSDVPLERLDLPVRAHTVLTNLGYTTASKLLGLAYDRLIRFRGIGVTTVEDILRVISTICVIRVSQDALDIVSEFCTVLGLCKSGLIREFAILHARFPEVSREDFLGFVYELEQVRTSAKTKLLDVLSKTSGGVLKADLLQVLPGHLSGYAVLDSLLRDLLCDCTLEVVGDRVYRRLPTFLECVNQVSDARLRDCLIRRYNGETLEAVGKVHGITRERVRQITERFLFRHPELQEDCYFYLFDTYALTAEELLQIFGEPTGTYNYLRMRSLKSRKCVHPLKDALEDPRVPKWQQVELADYLRKDYVVLDGEMVPIQASVLVEYFVRRNCVEPIEGADFLRGYHAWLNDLGIGDNPNAVITWRTHVDHLRSASYVLWSYGNTFRYYDVDARNYKDLLTGLNLEQYKDVELSTSKLFRLHPGLMKKYDIRNEYELHNLLRKILVSVPLDVKFKRMPIIEFGTADRNAQVLQLMLENVPISKNALSHLYEETYGVGAQQVRAGYFDCIESYYYAGVYAIK